jgi:quercetin dioxygenase-like cupin family protein
MKSGKVWGESVSLFKNDNFEVHRIEIDKGGYCSKHKHNFKHNIFFVESGILEVSVWKNDYDLCDKTTLSDGEIMDVPPGENHQFNAKTPVIAFEIYYSEPISGDIVRESCGGMK